ncbi:50S ribosomal protein L9 [Collinsella vaginalis]|uniref:50S ribosomal protein L9 n=1 Tax=Collinsella vaginalis TaxID=1870987 RepID=UPI000A269A00|nr:50S ribosomal protein L9 [Collinsella vaginalis]
MKVVLLDEIKGKGGEGDVIDVAQGYAENYLIPNKLAVAATKGNLKQLEERRRNIERREEVRIANANATKEALEGKSVTVDVKVGEEGVLFGSVTAPLIADAIQAQLGIEVDRKRVELGKPIKLAGTYPVDISLYREIRATVVVMVGTEALEAEEEAAAEAEETAEVEEAPEAEATATEETAE